MRWAALCIFPGVLAVAIGCSGKTAPEPISVGHLAPVTGPLAAVGKHAEQGITLAVEETNREENRINGRQVMVRHVDTGGDARTVAQEAVRLITVNKVAGVLGNLEAAPAEALGLEVQTYKVPVVVTAGPALPPSSKYLFPIGLTPRARGEALAHLVADKLKQTPVALLTPDRGPVAEAIAGAFTAQLGRQHVRILSYPADPPSGSEAAERKIPPDLEALARNVQAQKPGAVLIVGTASDCLRLRVALGKAGLPDKVPLLFGGDEEAMTALAAAGQPAEGIYTTTAFWLDLTAPRGQERAQKLPRARSFAKAYQDRYGEPPDAHAALGYDAARLLFEAMRGAKSLDGDKIQEQLAGMAADFDGLTGPLLRRPVFLVQIRGGQVTGVDLPAP